MPAPTFTLVRTNNPDAAPPPPDVTESLGVQVSPSLGVARADTGLTPEFSALVLGGAPPYSYQWLGTTVATPNDPTLSSTTYTTTPFGASAEQSTNVTMTVTDSLGLMTSASFTIRTTTEGGISNGAPPV